MNLWAHDDGRLLLEISHPMAFFRQAIFPMGDMASRGLAMYPTFTTDTTIPDGFAPLCTKVQSDKLLAEQAHRYRQDLDRLGDERDELVAQHDRDAETIAELRKERDESVDGKARPGKTRKPATQILERNAVAILAVPIPATPLHMGRVDATGTRRRLQALIAYGYSQRDISRRLGHQADNLTPVVNGSVTMVSRGTRDGITALFAELQMQPRPCSRSRNRGIANRWPLPLDWDEDEIDDPSATATRSPHRAYDPRFDPEKTAARRAKVAELIDLGVPATEIAARLRCAVRTIERDKQAIRAESLGVTA